MLKHIYQHIFILLSISFACSLLLLLPLAKSYAQTSESRVLTVTNTNDAGAGSLRQAIIDANATSDDENITFAIPENDLGCMSNGACTISLTSGELTVENNGSLTINGRGAGLLTISGNDAIRVFSIQTGSNVIMTGIHITRGRCIACNGGGINNNGTLMISNSIISRHQEYNVRPGFGGGIANFGSLTLINSTVRNNFAQFGGGIFNSGSIMNIINSTISDNSAVGGGIDNYSGTVNIINSTVSNNYGGGISNSNIGTINFRNSIIADNTLPNARDVSGTLNSLGYNLIENTVGATIVGNTTGNITGVDPLLDPEGLKNNGGPTPTIALLPGSPVIDAADPENVLPTDQCGFPRPVDGNGDGVARADIGAFEFASTAVSANLIMNPSFEQGYTLWDDWGNLVVFANPNAPGGSFELRIGTGRGGSFQTISVEAHTTYTLRAAGRVTAGETGWVGVHYLDSDGNEFAPQSAIEFSNTTSEQKQISLQPPVGTASLRVWTWKNEGSGYFFVDEISFTRE